MGNLSSSVVDGLRYLFPATHYPQATPKGTIVSVFLPMGPLGSGAFS